MRRRKRLLTPKPYRGLEVMALVALSTIGTLLLLLGLGEMAIYLTEGPP
jgi:hypothetical protein